MQEPRNNLQISRDPLCINQMLVTYHWTAGFPNTRIGHPLACDVAYISRQPHLSLQATHKTRRMFLTDIAPPLDLPTIIQRQVRGRSHCSAGYARHSIFGLIYKHRSSSSLETLAVGRVRGGRDHDEVTYSNRV